MYMVTYQTVSKATDGVQHGDFVTVFQIRWDGILQISVDLVTNSDTENSDHY